jgi:hypothetical protein
MLAAAQAQERSLVFPLRSKTSRLCAPLGFRGGYSMSAEENKALAHRLAGQGRQGRANAEGTDRIKAAYGPNYHRLVALKSTYDPTNLFRHNQNIKPTV